jgi:hypothetical protein
MNKYPLIGGSICAVVLIVLASLTNVVGYRIVQASNQKVINKEINPKVVLVQTIIDILDTPELQPFFIQHTKEWKNNQRFTVIDNEPNSLVQSVLKIKERIHFSLLSDKPASLYRSLMYDYDQGYKIMNLVGEKEVIAMMKSITFTTPQVINDLKNILMKNDNLKEKITRLSIINKEVKTDTQSGEQMPIICFILLILFASVAIRDLIFTEAFTSTEHTNPILSLIFLLIAEMFFIRAIIVFVIAAILGCIQYWPWPVPPSYCVYCSG